MKARRMGICVAMGTLFATLSVFAQTTTSRGTPTISGFAPNPVSGFNAQPVTGYTPAPIRGLAPLPVFPTTTNFTTGPIAPLSTGIAGANPSIQPAPVVPPLPPVSVVRPIRTNSPVNNAVGTPLF